MRTKTKLVILELTGGLFGWIWIAAAAASIFFLYGFMANDAPWIRLLWSLGAALLTKQIAAVLKKNQRRLDYVDQLASYGHTRTIAEEAWRLAAGGGTNLLLNLQQAEVGKSDDASPSDVYDRVKESLGPEVAAWLSDGPADPGVPMPEFSADDIAEDKPKGSDPSDAGALWKK